MNGYRTIALASLLAALTLLCGACGKHDQPAGTRISATPSDKASSARNLEEVLAEIDAYEPPPEVDRALFERMRANVREAVVSRWNSKVVSVLGLDEIGGNEIDDLKRSSPSSSPVKLKWSYRNSGDYTQGNRVGIEDITPIAIHYGESKEAGTWQSIDEVIDASRFVFFDENEEPMGKDLIGDAEGNGGWDLEVIALAYGNTISGYAVYGSNDPEGPFAEFDPPEFVPFEDIQGEDVDNNGIWDLRAWFDTEVSSRGRRYLTAVPVDGDSERIESLMGEPVDLTPNIESVRPMSGEPYEENVEVECTVHVRPPGTTYLWDFGGGAEPNILEQPTGTVILGEDGHYNASLTVDNGFATEVFEWTLEVTSAPCIQSVSPTKGADGEDVQFTVDWTGTRENVSYSWNFGGGATPNTSEEESPQVTLAEPGYYNAGVTITNVAGSDTFNFELAVGRPPVVVQVTPEEAVARYEDTYNAELEEYNSPPYEYLWFFGSVQMPTEESPEWTFHQAGLMFCSVTVSNDFGSDVYEFTVLVHKNKLWLVSEPSQFDLDHDWTVYVRVIAVDNGFSLSELESALVQYDGVATLEYDGINGGAKGGLPFWSDDPDNADGFWAVFNGHNVDAWLFFCPKLDLYANDPDDGYTILEGEEPTNPPAGSKFTQLSISPLILGEKYSAPVGSGLPFSYYVNGDSSPVSGDLFNLKLELKDYDPSVNPVNEVKVRLVKNVDWNSGGSGNVTHYIDDLWNNYEWYLVQDEDPEVPIPDRYYLRIPVDNS